MSSKFMRVIALSKTPADFRRPAAPKDEAATVSSLSTVDKLTTVDKLSTVDRLTTVGGVAINIDGHSVDPKLCKPATLVQHGHTAGEHAAYMTLWNLGGPPDRKDDFRDVSIGYDRLAAGLAGSKRNIQRLVDSLVRKFAVEILRAENSGTRQGKTYRVYGMTEILRRRKEAGYTYVLRNRSAVELVKMSTVDNMSTVDSLSTVTVDSLSTPLGSSFRNKTEETSSSAESTALVEYLARCGIALDDDAARRIITRCQNSDSAATVEEVVYFAELKVNQLAKRKNIENWPGLLIAAIPPYFDPPATELKRYRARKAQENAKAQTLANEILRDPQASEQDRDWARSTLSGLN
jgi:hypothetical protein